ncbi:MAG TPA: flagellar regulator YcgR PilZN domain-containing protein [Burkholderiaceae bacterium]
MSEPNNNETTKHEQHGRPDTLALLRSQAEIARILAEFCRRKVPVSASLTKGHLPFTSLVRLVDPERGYFFVEFSGDSAMDAAILTARSVTFFASQGQHRFEFIVLRPVEFLLEDTPCISFAFPDTMAAIQRRSEERTAIAPFVPLRCLADTRGFLSFECTVTDISRSGLGTMIYDDSILLEPGTILSGCEIDFDGDVVECDLEVRYSVVVNLSDGTKARRSGYRFINNNPRVDEILERFSRAQ